MAFNDRDPSRAIPTKGGRSADFIERMIERSEAVNSRRGPRVVLAEDEPTLTPRQTCSFCNKHFNKKHAVVVLDGLLDEITKQIFLTYIHRTCLEAMLGEGPVDDAKSIREFKEYRAKLAEIYT